MLLVLIQSGQMCNRLMTLIAAYSLGIKYGENVCCPLVCDKLKKNFEFDESASNVKTKMFNIPRMDKALWWVYWLLRVTHIYRFIPKKYNIKRQHKLQIFIDAFEHLDDAAVIENLSVCQKYFAFKPEIIKSCRAKIQDYRSEGRKLVAVHARRGDYKKYMGGKYYFDDEQLLRWMSPLNKASPVRFIFFSNEKINLTFYEQQGLDVIQSTGTDVEDLCCMSMCDYIMGPPSSFSWWAMVVGHKPRAVLDQNVESLSLKDFNLYESVIGLGE